MFFCKAPRPASPDEIAVRAAAFRDSLIIVAEQDLGHKLRKIHQGALVIWLPALGAFAPSTPHLSFRLRVRAGHFQLVEGVRPLLDAGGEGRLLCLNAGANTEETLLAVDEDALSITAVYAPTLDFATGAAYPPSPEVSAFALAVEGLTVLSMPLAGAKIGCLCFTGLLLEGFDRFEAGFVHEIRSPLGAMARLKFRLQADRPGRWEGGARAITLDPLDGNDPDRNTVPLFPRTRLPSAFTFGVFVPLWLEPLPESILGRGGRLVGAVTAGGYRYLAPDGVFRGYTQQSAAAEDPIYGLVCGLNPLETLILGHQHAIRFQPAAIALDDLKGSRTLDGWRFEPSASLASRRGAPWVSVFGDAPPPMLHWGTSQTVWYGADDRSAGVLARANFPCRPLPAAARPEPDGGFPLLPYAGLTPLETYRLAFTLSDVEQFERSLVAPVRHGQIKAMGGSVRVGDGLKRLLTSQGYLATATADGRIGSIELAGAGAGCTLKFDGQGQALDEEIVELFLHPQMFMVLSCDTAERYVSRYLQGEFKLGNWDIRLAFDPEDKIRAGDYRTVLILKAGHGSVAGRAASPKDWLGFSMFNRVADDPEGQAMSAWITGYFAAARELHADGKGLASLAEFCRLIDDPDWNGFLLLRVPVTGDFPDGLGFVRAGLGDGPVYLHHLGCANTPASADAANCVNGVSFGLVHYVDPNAEATGQNTLFVPGVKDYDFQVLRLDVVFAHNRMDSFACEVALVLGRLLGDRVIELAGAPDAANALVLQGQVLPDGSLLFLSRPGQSSRFYLDSAALDFIEVDHAAITSADAGGGRTQVDFRMEGWLSTRADSRFDVLSFDAIALAGLTVSMAYDTANGKNRSFTADWGQLSLPPKDEQPTGAGPITPDRAASRHLYRAGSMAEQFPLSVAGLVIGVPGVGPTQFGYQTLATGTDIGAASVDFKQPWLGIACNLPMGGGGALDSATLLAASMLFAWNPAAAAPAVAPFMRFTGPGGGSLSFQIEGVISLGVRSLILSRGDGDSPVFTLKLTDVGLSVLSCSFPPKGTTSIQVQGVPGQRLIGWLGVYDGGVPPEPLS